MLAGSHNTDPLEVANHGSNHVIRQCHAFAKTVRPCLRVCTSLTELGERCTFQLKKKTYKSKEEKFPWRREWLNQTEDSRKGKEKDTRGGNYWQLGNQQYGDLRAEWEELVDWKCLLGPLGASLIGRQREGCAWCLLS